MLGKPKRTRVDDPDMLRWVVEVRDGCCLYGLYTNDPCLGGLDPHHIRSRGAGGDDAPGNLVTLCRKHHNLAQEHKIAPERLREILSVYFPP